MGLRLLLPRSRSSSKALSALRSRAAENGSNISVTGSFFTGAESVEPSKFPSILGDRCLDSYARCFSPAYSRSASSSSQVAKLSHSFSAALLSTLSSSPTNLSPSTVRSVVEPILRADCILAKELNASSIWKTSGGRAGRSKKSVLAQAEEYRTSSCHEKHYLLKSAVTEARSSHQIRGPVPFGKGPAPLYPLSVRYISTQSALAAKQQSGREERSETGITTQEDPFDTLTDKIPVQPVSVAEGASYSIAILAGLAVAAAAAYTIFKELIVEPKEYKVYGKALDRVQKDMQIAGRLGSPIHGYGQESQNRAARQRISNRQWVDEDGVEHVEVMFHVRGPGGGGKVFSEMFKDPEDKSWKFTYLIVDVTNPTPKRFLLESYVPEAKVNFSPA